MTSLSLKLLTSSKMNKTLYHLKALVTIYRIVVLSMICDHFGKNKSPFFSFVADQVLKDIARVISVYHFKKLFAFLISILNFKESHQVSALYHSN